MFSSFFGHTLLTRGLQAPVVLDLGAHKGDFSQQLLQRFGGSHRLVEANPELVEFLANKGVAAENVAVGADTGTVTFHISHNSQASSVLALPQSSILGATLRDVVEVPSVSMESLLAEPIDVLKLDIEGAEVEALQAVSDAALRRVGQMSIEFHCDAVFEWSDPKDVEAIVARLRGLGFSVTDFSGGKRLDVLAINPRLLPLTPSEALAGRLLPQLPRGRHFVGRWRRRAKRALSR